MDARWEEWEEEIVECLAAVENVLGRALPDGYNKDTPCIRLTLDPVPTLHRPLLWYLIVGAIDFVTSLRLYSLASRHYSDKRLFQSLPLRPLTLLSRCSNVEGFSYWHRPHRLLKEKPILFLHGIGVGLYSDSSFVADLASQYPRVGIIVFEFLSISSCITSPPLSHNVTVTAIQTRALESDTSSSPPIRTAPPPSPPSSSLSRPRRPRHRDAPRGRSPFLLSPLSDVVYNFVCRAPRTVNE